MTKEAKAAEAAKASTPLGPPKFGVGDLVVYQTAVIVLHARVKAIRRQIRAGTKSDSEWHYELDTNMVPGIFAMPESFLSKSK